MSPNKQKLLKRMLLSVLIAAMVSSMLAGCGSTGNTVDTTAGTTADTTAAETEPAVNPAAIPFAEPVEITMIYPDQSNAPFREDWLVLDSIKKKTNVDLKVDVVPGDTYADKINLLVKTNDLPDILPNQWKHSWGDEATKDNVFVAINDYFDKLPNYKGIFEKWNAQSTYKNILETNGKLYYFIGLNEQPIYTSGPIVRTDLLKKYGMELKTLDDVYEFVKKYKSENPDSQPITDVWGWDCILHFIDGMWGVQAGWSNWAGYYYDYDQQKYTFMFLDDKYKNMLLWLEKLIKEGLFDTEIATQTDAQFQGKLINGKSIMTWFYSEMVPGLNTEGKKTVGPDFELQLIPPIAGPYGAFSNYNYDRDGAGWMIPTTSASKPYFDRLLAFCDWMYTEEGSNTVTWGEEGVTYNVINGKKVFSEEILTSPGGVSGTLQAKYGLNLPFTVCRSTEFLMGSISPSMREVAQNVIDNKLIRPSIPVFDLDDKIKEDFINPKEEELSNFVKPIQADILLGKKSVEEVWSKTAEELKKREVEKYLEYINAGIRK